MLHQLDPASSAAAWEGIKCCGKPAASYETARIKVNVKRLHPLDISATAGVERVDCHHHGPLPGRGKHYGERYASCRRGDGTPPTAVFERAPILNPIGGFSDPQPPMQCIPVGLPYLCL